MSWSLYDREGCRKYLTPRERAQFIRAALTIGGKKGAFCAVVALCGPRISEALALAPLHLDDGNSAINFETLKRRRRGIIRAVPVPAELLELLEAVFRYRSIQSHPQLARARLWPWCRTTGWKCIRDVMAVAGIPVHLSKPKALRHAFGIQATDDRISLGLIKKWLGHAKIETTEIYTTPIGRQERALARLTWRSIRKDLAKSAIRSVR